MHDMERKLLIFDLDGTLVDTLPSITKAINMCAEHFGYPKKTSEEVRLAVGNGVDVLLRETMPKEEWETEEQRLKIKSYFASCYETTQREIDSCYSGIMEALVCAKEKGFLLAVLSNKPDALVQIIVKNLFDDGFICKSMGQTDMPKKPDPYVPLLLAKTLDVLPQNTYFIGDSEVDVLTGKNAGMKTVAVSWGFRDRKVLEESKPDIIIDTRAELLEYFGNLT